MKELIELATRVATTEIENQKLKSELEQLKDKKIKNKITDYFDEKLKIELDYLIEHFNSRIENEQDFYQYDVNMISISRNLFNLLSDMHKESKESE